jgi:lipopolysaccharide export system permease protein
MLSVRQLNHAIDSIGNIDSFFYNRAERELRNNLSFVRYKDSAWQQKPLKDTNVTSFEEMVPTLNKSTIYDRALSEINNSKANISLLATDYNDRVESLRRHWIEWNRKFTLSVACLVLFMIGAPLGSIIRKGGLGTPLLFAIVFFVLFHLLNTFGEKAAKSGAINVFSGMWLSTIVLIPIGAFLTVKAMHDSQLFNKEAYYRLFKSIRQLFAKLRSAK